MRILLLIGWTILSCISVQAASAVSIPTGKGEVTVGAGERAIQVFTYKPKNFSSGPLIFVFHGASRNAADYRDYAVKLADRYHAVIAAPLFDAEHYPTQVYSWGGIVRKDGSLRDRKDWAYSRATEVIQAILKMEGDPKRDYYLIGHSGGAQFLTRYASLETVTAKRIVAANAGSYAFPRLDWDWGYGFGKLPKDFQKESAFKRLLATPMTLYLGTADTSTSTETGHFDDSEDANREGMYRLERGRSYFAYCQKLAKDKDWTFAWSLVEAPGVAHDANLMFNHNQFDRAIQIK